MKSEYIPLTAFIPADQLIKYYKNNVSLNIYLFISILMFVSSLFYFQRVGMFFMSITMYDAMKAIESKLLYVIMISWIRVSL